MTKEEELREEFLKHFLTTNCPNTFFNPRKNTFLVVREGITKEEAERAILEFCEMNYKYAVEYLNHLDFIYAVILDSNCNPYFPTYSSEEDYELIQKLKREDPYYVNAKYTR